MYDFKNGRHIQETKKNDFLKFVNLKQIPINLLSQFQSNNVYQEQIMVKNDSGSFNQNSKLWNVQMNRCLVVLST